MNVEAIINPGVCRCAGNGSGSLDTTFSQTSTTLLGDVALGDNPYADRLFVQRYAPLAQAAARAAGVGPDDIDDVVQETMMAAVQGLRERRYDRPTGRFKAWFKGILFHKINRLRRDRARRTTGGDDALARVPDPAPSPAEQVAAVFEQEWARVILEEARDDVRQRVDPVNWQAYDLVERQGCKPSAVARLLGIRRSQVYNAVSRIRQHLEEAIHDLTRS